LPRHNIQIKIGFNQEKILDKLEIFLYSLFN
jgi:hypothetical protein